MTEPARAIDARLTDSESGKTSGSATPDPSLPSSLILPRHGGDLSTEEATFLAAVERSPLEPERLYELVREGTQTTAPRHGGEPPAPIQALRKLRAEVAGILGYAENDIRDVIGLTNLNVLKLRVKEADAALADTGARQTPPTPPGLCACAMPDPVMQADQRFYCYACSLPVPAVLCEHCRASIVTLEEAGARQTSPDTNRTKTS